MLMANLRWRGSTKQSLKGQAGADAGLALAPGLIEIMDRWSLKYKQKRH
jgi:hypothetical protein